jgi:hypothetical protein
LACLILSLGIPGLKSLPPFVTASILLYFAACSLIINDWIKVKVN